MRHIKRKVISRVNPSTVFYISIKIEPPSKDNELRDLTNLSIGNQFHMGALMDYNLGVIYY